MSNNSSDNPQAGQGRPLPKKEADLFRHLVKHYEAKQYKKAIKQADGILKKFPNHGETLAMKGLTVYYASSDRKEEAHALVKQGLTNDMRSHVCWHVYGLLHRADRNYLEAIKAYKQALRIDADNLQILRDLSLLQIQMRDLAGFVVTRNSILNLKPTIQQHWLAFALARKMVDDTQGALQVIDIYLGTLVEGSPELSRNYEPSEMQMYKNWLLLELKDYKEALEHLEKVERIVVDRSGWLWHKATCHYHLGEYDKCKKTLEQMMHRGMTEDYRIHTAYMCAVLERNDVADDWGTWTGMNTLATMLVLNEDQRRLLLQLYCNDLKESFPKSPAIQRIPITLLEGEEWLQALNVYCQKGLVKGVPSLAHDLSSFLLHPVNGRYKQLKDPVDVKNDWKYEKLCVLADSYISNLESSSRFSETDEEAQPPSTIFWAWYLRAGLHEIAAEYSQGLAYLTKCLDHTPTAVDVYEMRARFLKAAGDLSAAVDAIDKGRELDQQDRYMNNMTTKYMLQAGDPETALSRIGLFISKEDGPEKNLYDMQCSWYELELADCLARQEQWGRSLKKYDAVLKHFEDIHEDQFDFHSYCIRKVTLRAYSDVLQWEDNLWGQPYYRRAAEGTMRIYLHLQDNPSLTKEFEEPDYSGMSAAEKKKAKAIARKKKKAAEKKAADETEDNKPTDDDPDGLEYLKKNYLEECQKLSAVLSKHAPGQISTWICQYDVAVRRGKAAMALQALFKAQALDSRSSELFSRIVDFAGKVKNFKESAPPVVKEVLDTEFSTLLGHHKSLEEFVLAARNAVGSHTTLSSRVAIATALAKQTSPAEAAKLVIDGISGRGVTLETCREALAALKTLNFEEDSINQWIAAMKERFPLLKAF